MGITLLLISFAVVIVLIWLKVNIGISIFTGALTLALLSGLGISGTLKITLLSYNLVGYHEAYLDNSIHNGNN